MKGYAMVNVVMLINAYGLNAGQFSQFTVEEFARLKAAGVCEEIKTEIAEAKPAKVSPTKKK